MLLKFAHLDRVKLLAVPVRLHHLQDDLLQGDHLRGRGVVCESDRSVKVTNIQKVKEKFSS